jgi:hypothetical protein
LHGHNQPVSKPTSLDLTRRQLLSGAAAGAAA